MNTFHLSVLAAEKPFYDGDCVSLQIPTANGLYGIQANHRNMIAAIVPGVLRYRLGDEWQIAAVSAGLIKVEDNDVLILTDTAERPEEIDENRARNAADEAKEALLQRQSIREYQAAKAKMARALCRLKVKGQTYNQG